MKAIYFQDDCNLHKKLNISSLTGAPTMALNKADLTDAIYNQLDLPKTKSAKVVDCLVEIIKKTLKNGEDILISGFGKFSVKEKNKRKGKESTDRGRDQDQGKEGG